MSNGSDLASHLEQNERLRKENPSLRPCYELPAYLEVKYLGFLAAVIKAKAPSRNKSIKSLIFGDVSLPVLPNEDLRAHFILPSWCAISAYSVKLQSASYQLGDLLNLEFQKRVSSAKNALVQHDAKLRWSVGSPKPGHDHHISDWVFSFSSTQSAETMIDFDLEKIGNTSAGSVGRKPDKDFRNVICKLANKS